MNEIKVTLPNEEVSRGRDFSGLKEMVKVIKVITRQDDSLCLWELIDVYWWADRDWQTSKEFDLHCSVWLYGHSWSSGYGKARSNWEIKTDVYGKPSIGRDAEKPALQAALESAGMRLTIDEGASSYDVRDIIRAIASAMGYEEHFLSQSG